MSLRRQTLNPLVDVFVDSETGLPVEYAAKGGSVIRSTITAAEGDALAQEAQMERDEVLPSETIKRPARCGR